MAVRTDDPHRAAAPLQQLTEALLAESDDLAARAARRMQEQLTAYAEVPLDDLTPVVRANTRNLLEMILDPEGDPERTEADYRTSGETRASQGITIDEMLHAWRIGLEVTRERAREKAEGMGIGKDVVLDFIETMLALGDRGMLASARAHREAEFEIARHEQHHRANLVKGILFGSLSPAVLRVQAGGYGLDLAASYQAVRARPSEEVTVRAIERQLGVADSAGPRRGLAALLDGDLVGFVIAQVPGTVAATVGVGPPAALHELSGSFRRATRALEGAIAVGATGPVAIGQLGLWPAVIADRDVGDELLARIVEPVLAEDRIGELALDTVVRYLDNDLRLEVTAEQMFLHVNTVRYRLRRFEELSGMSLREVGDLVQVWWAIQRHRLSAGVVGTDNRVAPNADARAVAQTPGKQRS
jgi:PucR C-terminal helix-turn-helix domain